MRARTRNAWVVGLGLAVALASAGCSSSGEPPTTGCTDESRSAGEPGDAEPMLVLGSLGFDPTIVYADGAVVIPLGDVDDAGADAAGHLRAPMMMPGYYGDQPGGFVAGWLSDCELAAVIERADALFEPGVDFGEPQVTDSDSTNASYGGVEVSVYAFSRNDPTGHGGLSGAQERARRDLADLWTVVEDATEVTGPIAVDRLFVRTFSDDIADADAVDWPLDLSPSQLSAQGCVTVDDPAQVARVLERLENPEPLLVDQPWRVAVIAAAPGAPDCES